MPYWKYKKKTSRTNAGATEGGEEGKGNAPPTERMKKKSKPGGWKHSKEGEVAGRTLGCTWFIGLRGSEY